MIDFIAILRGCRDSNGAAAVTLEGFMKGVGLGKRRNVDGQMASLAVESAAAVIESRAAVSSKEQYVNFYSGVARADRGPFVLSPW